MDGFNNKWVQVEASQASLSKLIGRTVRFKMRGDNAFKGYIYDMVCKVLESKCLMVHEGLVVYGDIHYIEALER